jgi:hypothetical protein
MKTDIIAILDRSGSMSHLVNDTIGGYNEFINKQRVIPGEARVSLVLFDQDFLPLYTRTPIKDVPPLTGREYYARGSTALLDAIGRTMNEHANQTASEKWPDKVLVLICTDGEENASKEFTKDKIKAMISHAESMGGWEFMYLSANPTAFTDAAGIGLKSRSTASYSANKRGTQNVYGAMSASVAALRSSNVSLAETLSGLKSHQGVLDGRGLHGLPDVQSQQGQNALAPIVGPGADLSRSTPDTVVP